MIAKRIRPELLRDVPDPAPAGEARERVQVKNADAFLALFGSAFIPFNGVVYKVPPLPARLGAKLYALRHEIISLGAGSTDPADAEREADLCARAVSLFPDACRPIGWRGVLWRLTPAPLRRGRLNPFRNLSAREVAEFLGFFCACRMRSRVRPPGATQEKP